MGDRAVAWLDDAFGDVARQWAAERHAPKLLVDVDPTIGLTWDLIEVLAAWPGSVATRSAARLGSMNKRVYLRAVTEEDLRLLNREWTDPELPGEFQWFGFRPARGLDLERRLPQDGLIGGGDSWLVVALADGSCVGWVVWRPAGPHGNWEIGCMLLPEHRGTGIGTEAQRRLVEYLFDTTPANRIQAGTEAGNIAEQRALEKAGFIREGVMRGLYFRGGAWRDSVMYGVTRDDID